MTVSSGDAVAEGPRRRFTLPLLVGAAVLLLLVGAWLGWRGLQAKSHLEAAQAAAVEVKDDLAAGDVDRARSTGDRLQVEAREAHRLTSDPVWRAVAALPFAGDNLRAVAEVADVVDGLASGTMPRLLSSSDAFDPDALRPSGRRVDLALLADVRPALRAASADVTAAQQRVDDLRGLHVVGPVAEAVDELHGQLRDAGGVTSDAATAARLLPPMLGGDGERRYLLAFQNNAEARGTGGLLGAYGLLVARHGKVRLEHLGTMGELQSARRLPVEFGKEYRNRYGDDPALWNNANLSPHFPYAARTWLALWKRQFDQRLDGVIATDPVVLGYLLDATGPVTLPDGTRVTGDSAARFTMSQVYAKFPASEQDQIRDAYLQQVASAAFTRLFAGKGEPRALLDALDRGASERRLLVYTRHDAEQRVLAHTVLGGTLSEKPGPRVAVAVNNTAGNKLDYYLDREVSYGRESCDGARQRSRVDVTLTSTAPVAAKLPQYVKVRSDDAAKDDPRREGVNRSRVSVFLPVGARLKAATLDGGTVEVRLGEERDRPTVDFSLEIRPGQSRTVVLWLDEPAWPGRGHLEVQPLVRPALSRVTTSPAAASCASSG